MWRKTKCSDAVNLPSCALFFSVPARSSRTSTRMSSIHTSCPSLTALQISSHSLCRAPPRPKCRYNSTQRASTQVWMEVFSASIFCSCCYSSTLPTVSSSSAQFRTFLRSCCCSVGGSAVWRTVTSCEMNVTTSPEEKSRHCRRTRNR